MLSNAPASAGNHSKAVRHHPIEKDQEVHTNILVKNEQQTVQPLQRDGYTGLRSYEKKGLNDEFVVSTLRRRA